MEIECEVCGKHLSGSDKIIVYGELPYWDGYEYHTFFCCKLHASEYMWAIARRYGSFNLNPNYSFWFKTVAELEEEIDEYEIEQEQEKQDRENEKEFFDSLDDYKDEDKEIICEQCGKLLTGKDKVILVEYDQYEPVYICSDRCYSLFIFHQASKITKKVVVVDSTADKVMEA